MTLELSLKKQERDFSELRIRKCIDFPIFTMFYEKLTMFYSILYISIKTYPHLILSRFEMKTKQSISAVSKSFDF